MICTPSLRPPRSQWPTNLILRDATAFMSLSPSLRRRYAAGVGFQPAAKKQLSNARIGENGLRSILDARPAELEYNSKIRLFECTLRVLLDHQDGHTPRTHIPDQ